MLFPEKMIDFVRTTGPLIISGESLASGKDKQRWPKKKKQKKKKPTKKKKKKKNIKKKFEPQTFNLHQIIQRELMIGFFISRNTFCISRICDRHFGSQQKVGCLTQ